MPNHTTRTAKLGLLIVLVDFKLCDKTRSRMNAEEQISSGLTTSPGGRMIDFEVRDQNPSHDLDRSFLIHESPHTFYGNSPNP